MPEAKVGAEFLHKQGSTLHTKIYAAGEEKPTKIIEAWLSRLSSESGKRHLQGLGAVDGFIASNLIKPEKVPQAYWNSMYARYEAEGRGGDLAQAGVTKDKNNNAIFPENIKNQQVDTITTDQSTSLRVWTDYLLSPDSNAIPAWAKYWAINGVCKLGTYDKTEHKFNKRDATTVAPFATLDREALAKAIDLMQDKLAGKAIDDQRLRTLLDSGSFAKIYAYTLEDSLAKIESDLKNTQGQWVKFDQWSSHTRLTRSLEGYGTGWCIAGESYAKPYLDQGDFYIYYSNDATGASKVPRAAIRMEGDRIAEVRGIAPGQNMDEYITPVVEEKLVEFGEKGARYKKQVADMRQLTEIGNRAKEGTQLSREELRFLYQIDSKINGFGYAEDPRIQEILATRNHKADLAFVLDCSQDEISTTREEAMVGNILFHYGDLYTLGLNVTKMHSADGIRLPRVVTGDLNLVGMINIEGMKLPETVGGNVDLSSLRSTRGLKLPETVGGNLDLRTLTSAEGLELPLSVGGNIDLTGLKSAAGLKPPKKLGGVIYYEWNSLG